MIFQQIHPLIATTLGLPLGLVVSKNWFYFVRNPMKTTKLQWKSFALSWKKPLQAKNWAVLAIQKISSVSDWFFHVLLNKPGLVYQKKYMEKACITNNLLQFFWVGVFTSNQSSNRHESRLETGGTHFSMSDGKHRSNT